ncbi:MAG: hypothetical protein ACI8UD_000884 [Planctomycetota bacterium]|jgi:hypothetical protein
MSALRGRLRAVLADLLAFSTNPSHGIGAQNCSRPIAIRGTPTKRSDIVLIMDKPTGALSMVLVPAVISLVVTVLRLVGGLFGCLGAKLTKAKS